MAIILNIETATTNCSVSVAKDGEVIGLREFDSPNYSHSEKLHVFIAEALKEASVAYGQIGGVAVSKGPGSYTGLRIGVSAAKGLCFAWDVPLISVPTLLGMAQQRLPSRDIDFIVPVLDARRMEVYSAVYNAQGEEVRETRAEVIEKGSFARYAGSGKTLLIGSGAKKCQEVLVHPNLIYEVNAVP